MRRRLKKLMSCLLAVAMIFTSLSLPINSATVDAAAKSVKAKSSNVTFDTIGVKVDKDDHIQTMKLYLNGVYETELALKKGEHSLTVINDGNEIGTIKVTVNDDKSVYVRLQDGKLVDSINNADQFEYASIVGNFNGLEFLDEKDNAIKIAPWDPADGNAVMDYVGGGIYKKTVRIKELASDVKLENGYKVAFNGNWDRSIGDGSDNIALTVPAKTKEITFFADAINNIVYDSVRTKAYAVSQNDGEITYPAFNMVVSVIGTVRGDEAKNWKVDEKGFEFTQISDHLFLYQAEMKKGSYEYKTCFNYEKWYENGSGNCKLDVAEDGAQVIFLYDAKDESLFDSLSNGDVIAEKLGIKAEPAAEASVTTNANGTTKFLTTASTDKNDTVKLVWAKKSAPKDKKEEGLQAGANGSGKFNNTFVSRDMFFGDEALDIIYYYTVNGTKVLDSSAQKVTVDGEEYSSYTRKEFKGRFVSVPGTLNNNNWNPAKDQMHYDGNGNYSCTFKDVIPANYEFKIAMGTWDENYGQEGKPGGANYKVTVPEKQDVTVYYNDTDTHLAVTSVDYIVADITLEGTGIPKDTKFADSGYKGIYSCTVSLKAGTYGDVKINYNKKDYPVDAFTLAADKNVTFYFDPTTEIYYNDSSEAQADSSKVFFDSRDVNYKSTYGAAEEGAPVTYRIKTGNDATKAQLVVKGVKNKTVELKKETKEDGTYWSGDLTMEAYGQYKYFFVLYYGSTVKIYCDDDGNYGRGHVTNLTSLRPYDLTVYKKGYKTPDWMKNAVMYQIFPDRFCNGDTSNDAAQTTSRGATNYEFISNWNTIPENPEQEQLHPDTYPQNAFKGDGLFSTEIYGGDLKGIINRMDYLKALGVNVIYINPVFASISSHRYDTTDYRKIDPILGDLGDFHELVEKAKDHDMHIVLDGVFNHVCDDSIYFDRYYKFVGKDGKVGAYPYWAYVYDYMAEHKASKADAEQKAMEYFKGRGVTDFTYTGWFGILQTQLIDHDEKLAVDSIGERKGKPVYSYESWWGYDNMPVILATNGSELQTKGWADEVIEGKDSVTQYWLDQGSNGWRLDVANEVSDETWQHFRNSVKSLSDENVVIGEIWTDATKYLLGDMYDSVMNYVYRDAALAYVKGGKAADTLNSLENMRERYPKEAFYAMMNLVASHDTSRVLSYLDGVEDDRAQKDIEKAFPSYKNTSDEAKQKQYLNAFLQLTYPGAPMIYYGDEMGMVGADDPDNRRAVPWGEGNKEIVEWYAKIAKIRSQYSALRTGDIKSFAMGDNVLGYVRSDDKDKMIVLMNNAGKDLKETVDAGELISAKGTDLYEVVSGKKYTVSAEGKVEVTIPAERGIILTANMKEIVVDTNALKPAYDESFKVTSNLKSVMMEQTMTLSEERKITPVLDPINTADVKGVWKSSNEAVATVKDGVVTPLQEGTTEISVTFGNKTAVCKVTISGLGNVEGIRIKNTDQTNIYLEWNALRGAKGYEVYRKDGSSWKKIADVNATNYTDRNLVWSTSYTYKVRPYYMSGKDKKFGAFTGEVTGRTTAVNPPVQVTGLKLKVQKGPKIKLEWNKVNGASGYEVYMKVNRGSYKKIMTIGNGSKTYCKIDHLQEAYNYQFAVRAYTTVSHKTAYGAFSSRVGTLIAVSAPKNISASKRSRNKAKVNWSKVNGVSGYEITMSTNGGKYKVVSNVKKGKTTSVNVSNLRRGKTYVFKIRAYKIVDGRKYYSKTTTSKKFKMR